MKRFKQLMRTSIALTIVGVLVGCSTGNYATGETTSSITTQVVTNTVTKETLAPSSTTTSVAQIVDNVVIADSSLPGYSGQRIQLVDVKGQFVDNTTPGPYPEGSEWTGKFALRVVGPTGKLFSSYPLPSFYNQFNGKFHLHFADYNGNGLSDFALGQYMDSNKQTSNTTINLSTYHQ